MSPRLSGAQREVTHLYRRVLRAAKQKDGGSGSTTELVRAEFREKARRVSLDAGVCVILETSLWVCVCGTSPANQLRCAVFSWP